MIKNTLESYGLITRLGHWVFAILTIGLFVMGIWMRDLGYYDPWYNRAPELHKSIGLFVIALFIFRLFWRYYDPVPASSTNLARWERISSRIAHFSLHLLALVILLSGYLIATADNHGVAFFDLFSVPAVFTAVDKQEDIAGEIHEVGAWVMMALVMLHTCAALKHHFIDKDITLTRMLGIRRGNNKSDNGERNE